MHLEPFFKRPFLQEDTPAGVEAAAEEVHSQETEVIKFKHS